MIELAFVLTFIAGIVVGMGILAWRAGVKYDPYR